MEYAATGKIDNLKKNEKEFPDYQSIFEKIYNTKPEIIFEKLLSNKSDKLLFKNFNVLSKNELSQFGINKKLNNREAYFHFLEYIINVVIIDDEDEDDDNKKAYSKTKKQKKKKSKVPRLIIDFSGEKIDIIKNSNNISDNYIIINENENYGEMISPINVDIEKDFSFNELISIKNLRNKMEKFYDDLTFKDNKFNNIPDFQSELYYHYQLQNILETFKELDDEEFTQKIKLTKSVSHFIYNVKENKIKDRIILNYFYFIIDFEYEIDPLLLVLSNEYEENYSFNNCKVDEEKKELSINDIIKITNFDCYNIKKDDIEKIKKIKYLYPKK